VHFGITALPTPEFKSMAHKILIVDDEIGLCKMIAKVLRNAEYECIVAHSGEEALEAFHTTPPDLVLLDIAMPGITGWDVAQQIRQEESAAQPPAPKLPIIIMSAHSRLFDLAEELDLSIDSFLTKPLDLAEVVMLVTDILKSRERPAS
jgi:two-component system response regulator MtrA